MRIKKISIIIPVFNEEKTVAKTIKKMLSLKLKGISKEIIIINDGSTDHSLKVIKSFKNKQVKLINKPINMGKGAAIQSALKIITGDIGIIQDADLEYNPDEIKKLIKPIKDDLADVVFGSRFMGGEPHRVHLFWHMIGNNFLTLLTSMVTNLNLTDMETCYKMFTKKIGKNLDIKENRFGFEPEFSIKVAQMKVKVYEVGISYSGRNYSEGKKINWKDGIWAIWCIIKYGFLQK